MSADPILYCLERLSDYRQLERLASDLMVGIGYESLEPIGGSGDGGRDALHIAHADGRATIFAYSARADWEAKFNGDCKRIAQLGHSIDDIVFVSTRPISAQKKDTLRAKLLLERGWGVEFYDCERLRAQLVGPQKALLGHHPSIFVSPWFERAGGELVSHEQRDLVLIDHLSSDHALATWLYRKLTSIGYSVWCHGHAPLAGENADQSVRTLISLRAVRYLPLLSNTSAIDPDFRARISAAMTEPGRTLPCWSEDLSTAYFDQQLAKLTPARFSESWSAGLFDVQRQLEVGGIVKTLDETLGKALALSSYQSEPLLINDPETVYANVFSVTVPSAIHVYELINEDAKIDPILKNRWAHYRRGKWIFSFTTPPETLPLHDEAAHKYAWQHILAKFGANSTDVVKILVKRSLFVACYRSGFKWCDIHNTLYLDEPYPKRHGYQHVDETYSNVSYCGTRSWGGKESRTSFNFQLGPVFRVTIDHRHSVSVLVRFYVRVTDAKGVPFEGSKIQSRRKRVVRSWWNRQWLQRTLGVMQFIAGDGADINGVIVVGEGTEMVTVKVKPLSWECPVGIDVIALDRIGSFSEEIASARDLSPASNEHDGND